MLSQDWLYKSYDTKPVSSEFTVKKNGADSLRFCI